MKKYVLLLILIRLITSCAAPATVTKKEAYPKMYDEKPLSILVMPPINRSTHAEAKEWFLTTLMQPVSSYGFYVFPSIMTTEILKNESAYDAEIFVDAPLEKFNAIFGADALLFTTINKWDKNTVLSLVTVNIGYELKSTKSNEVLWSKQSEINVDTSLSSGAGGWVGLVVDVAASAINTAATDYVPIARQVNSTATSDVPFGKYHPRHGLDAGDISKPTTVKK